MKAADLNLDDENVTSDFIDTYSTLKGVALANRLGISGKGKGAIATALSNYAWNKFTALRLRRLGKIDEALRYEEICDRIYEEDIPVKYSW